MRLFNHVDLNVIGVVATAEEISVIGLPERPLQFDYLPLPLYDTNSPLPCSLGRTLNPFAWHRKEIELSPHIRTFNTIKSLAGGVAAVLELIETDELNEADCSCYGRVLSKHQTGALMRLAIAASQVIETECDDAFDWAEETRTG